MTKKLLVPALIFAVSGAAIFGTSLVRAQDSDTTRGPALLIQNLTSRFGLNQDEVQEVFDTTREQERVQRQAQQQANLETRLSEAVSAGELTEEQKQLILSKHQEMGNQNKDDSWFDLSPEERRAQADSKRSELESWANENGIDTQYLFSGFANPETRGQARGQGMHRYSDSE